MKRIHSTLTALALLSVACGSPPPEEAPSSTPAEQPSAEVPADPTPPAPQAEAPAQTPARQAPAPQTPPPEPREPEPEPAPAPEPRVVIPAETTMLFTMDEDISTRDNEAGDQFTLSLSEDLLGSDGAVLLPVGTQAVGVITEAAKSPSSDEPAVLRFTVQSVVFQNELVPLSGQVVETAIEGDERTGTAGTAARIAGGAAAGAVIGRVVGGGNRDAVVGAVAGAAAGTALWLATRDGHAELPRGAVLTFTLGEPVMIY